MLDLRRVVHGFALAALIALIALAAGPSAATERGPAPYGSDQKFANGLWMLTFEAPAGQVRVNLPERLRQGELVSGTVELYPRGEGDVLLANLAALEAHALRIDGEEVALTSRSFRWLLAAGEANGRVELLDAAGAAVADVPTTLSPAGQRPAARVPFALPELVQRGHSFVIRGTFDGDFATTRVRIAGEEARKLAESSDLLVVENVAEQVGRVRALVAEGSRRQRAAFHSVEVRLSAPEGPAAPGDSMALRVTVEGLAGLRRTFPLVVYNHRPQVASLDAGETLSRVVGPDDVGADGVFELDLTAAVKSAGEASFVAGVVINQAVPHLVDVTWPPHTPNVTFPTYHAVNVTWPPHTANVTFPGHVVNFTWPAHVPNGTFPTFHAVNITFPPHVPNTTFANFHAINVTWPPHVPNGTFPGVHAANVTWPPHTPNVTFPTYHIVNASWPAHQPNVTFPPVIIIIGDDEPGPPGPIDDTDEGTDTST